MGLGGPKRITQGGWDHPFVSLLSSCCRNEAQAKGWDGYNGGRSFGIIIVVDIAWVGVGGSQVGRNLYMVPFFILGDRSLIPSTKKKNPFDLLHLNVSNLGDGVFKRI